MNLEIIQTLVFPVISVVSYFAWQKYQDRDYFWIMWVAIVGLTIDILRYVITSTFELTSTLSTVMSTSLIVVWIVLILFLIKVGIWGSKK
ncbi:MAG: hypothetical protein UY63_C0008G0004 [Parcubacteria group bacterium GW2011_GWA2_51_10]|nr:MAG: hypothetical protein UY63_C0008G0004 [Parcubacteria group bacterium GW2011_GWA2_51_10]